MRGFEKICWLLCETCQVRDCSLLLEPFSLVQPMFCYLEKKQALSSNTIKISQHSTPSNIIVYEICPIILIALNCHGITLTSIAAKIYNALLHSHRKPKIKKILRKSQNGFWRNWSTTSQILTIRWILEGVQAKNLEATILFADFSKAFDSIHRGKVVQILLAYALPKETVATIMMLYRNTKVKVLSLDGDTD